MNKPKPKYLKLEKQRRNDWALNYPAQWEFLDQRFEKAEAALNRGEKQEAKRICLEILQSCPEYIPAINRLALLFREEGDFDQAIKMFESVVGLGLACLPKEFKLGKDRVPWYWEDNRAFLLANEHLATTYVMKAVDAFNLSLELNPGYHGIADIVEKLCTICGLENDVSTPS